MSNPIYHQLLCTDSVVRAILDGRQTQDRRPIKFQYDGAEDVRWVDVPDMETGWHPWRFGASTGMYPYGNVIKCPTGKPGDRLWVREGFKATGMFSGMTPRNTKACRSFIYRADGEQPLRYKHTRWRPNIHMPRWASRITLEVLGVRVERVQDISDDDAVAEGCEGELVDQGVIMPSMQFKDLWDSLYGKTEFSWGADPWVWVTDFKKIEVKT